MEDLNLIDDYRKIWVASSSAILRAYSNHAEFAVTEYEDLVIIAFPGTRDLKDWLVNLIPFRWKGFRLGWYCKALRLLPYVRKHLKPGIRVVFTGHSAGGAIAQIMASIHRHETVSLVTFGAPRAISRYRRKKLSCATVEMARIIHSDDLVPSLVTAIGLVHCPARAIVLPDSSPKRFDLVADHDMAAYHNALARIFPYQAESIEDLIDV